MVALTLLAWLLSSPSLWVERDADALLVSADARPLFDETLKRRLTSGLSTTLVLTLTLLNEDEEPRAERRHLAVVRYDLWDETLSAELDGTPRVFASLSAFMTAFALHERARLATDIPQDEQVYRLKVVLTVNPLSAEQRARMRSWLASPSAPTALDPVSGSLLGSFVRLFDNLKPGVAERTYVLYGQPFRADRLPFARSAP